MFYKNVTSIEFNFSVMGLGGRCFGGKPYYQSFDENKAKNIIDLAISNGINFIDTSPIYGNGYSECFIGDYLKQTNKRNKVFLATRCGVIRYGNNKYRHDLSKSSIIQELEESLKRLQTDYIDLYEFTASDPNTDIIETMETLVSLKKQGKIGYIGMNNYAYDEIRTALRVAKVNAVSAYYNIIDRNAEYNATHLLNYRTEQDVFRICYEENIAMFSYSGLLQGLLSENYLEHLKVNDTRKFGSKILGKHKEAYASLVKELINFSHSIGKTLPQVALSFLVHKPLVTSVLIGVSSKEQLQENLKALDFKLSTDELTEIERIVKPFCLYVGEVFS